MASAGKAGGSPPWTLGFLGSGHPHNIKMSKSTVEKPAAAPRLERAAGFAAEQPILAAFGNSNPSQVKVKGTTASTSRYNSEIKQALCWVYDAA